tara:strand:+ start:12726 stop:12950 length:225 start_codon:yes stop_codon:yes gene_type:complete
LTGYSEEELAQMRLDLTALRSAASKGITKLRNSVGEEITYRSLEEMYQQIARMERKLAPQATVRQHYPTFRKGT